MLSRNLFQLSPHIHPSMHFPENPDQRTGTNRFQQNKELFVPDARSCVEDTTDDIYNLRWACK